MSAKSNQSSLYTVEDLYRGLVNSNPSVLEYLYKEGFPAVQNFVLKNSGGKDDAKDIFQEAIMAAWMNAQNGRFKLKQEINPQAYIYQVARNKWLDRLKSSQHRKTLNLHGKLQPENPKGDDNNDHEESERRLAYLLELYNRLDNGCKKLLDKFYFEKKSMKQISTETGYDADSLRTMKYRCMQKLRKWNRDLNKRNKYSDEQS